MGRSYILYFFLFIDSLLFQPEPLKILTLPWTPLRKVPKKIIREIKPGQDEYRQDSPEITSIRSSLFDKFPTVPFWVYSSILFGSFFHIFEGFGLKCLL